MPLLTSAVKMALPDVQTLLDCADYEQAFGRFLPQLYDLHQHVLACAANSQAWTQLYLSTNPAISGLAFAIATIPIFFVVSEINKNYSQVDRVWSILPTLFNIHYAVWTRLNGLPTARVNSVLAFSVFWSIRLTFNYWRRGGYQIGSEDYRWELIKKRVGSVGFVLLNVFFVCSVQPVLLWAVTLPTYLLLLTSRVEAELRAADVLISGLLMSLVVFEFFADQQQWNYQEAKKEYQKTAKVPRGWTRAQMERGFVTTGLWKYSRHPNFAAEQAIWILLYHWSCLDTGSIYNWTFGGVLGYSLVFQGSTPLTEGISSSKYPEYRVYQERVGKFVPKLFGKRWSEREMEQLGPAIAEGASKAGKKKA